MKLSFLIGTLCGVTMAAAVTFTLAIPGNYDHWRAEIVDHGGGAWYLDRNGNIGWTWTAQPRSERGHLPIRPNTDSSCEQL